MFLTISLAIVDTRSSSFDAPQQGEVITGQTARYLVRRLGCVVERSGTDISHTLSFYFPNVIGLVQRIVRFICVPNRKPCIERFNTNTRIVTPLLSIYLSIYLSVCLSINLSIYLSSVHHPSFHPSICQSNHPSIHLSVHMSICLSIYQFIIHLSINSSAYLSILIYFMLNYIILIDPSKPGL